MKPLENPLLRALTPFVLLLAFTPLAAQEGGAATSPRVEPARLQPWDPAVVHRMRMLPVQELGRVKPFMTFAQYLLLRLNERGTVRIPDEARFGTNAGAKLNETEWALDVLLYPEQAADYPVILVTDSEALQLIGLSEVARQKRDRYSWNELAPGLPRLTEFAEEYSRIEKEDRSRLQSQMVNLYEDLHQYAGLRYAFEAARIELPIGDSPTLQSTFGSVASVRFSDAMTKTNSLISALSALERERVQESETGAEFKRVNVFLQRQYQVAQLSASLFWLPPVDPNDEVWLNYVGAFDQLRGGGRVDSLPQYAAIASLERVVDSVGDPAALAGAIDSFVAEVSGMAAERGEGVKIAGEVSYLEGDYFYKALVWFLFGFVGCALGWLWPRNRWIARIAFGLTAVGTAYVTYGLVLRCILRGRPPVTTLYETILFITATVAIVALIIEAINRRRIALSIAAFLGAFGMFLASKFEIVDGHDTFHQLIAVLDTNFWLATHVTTVTIGYAAGLLAGTIASVYLLGKLFGFRRGNHAFYRSIGRMVYGALCFGVLFSTVGTILGGVWANYSWGRFWGWDPKENGALLIVLWELMILHGRLGGYWRDWGVCMLAVAGNIVVAFSWWGVNLMSVGLHSYGFLGASLKNTVTAYYISQAVILALGIFAWARERARANAAVATEPAGFDAEPAEA